MMASKSHQGQGLGKEALQMIDAYASKHLKISPTACFAKIGMSNVPSLQLFGKVG